jgi:hypothetical protein
MVASISEETIYKITRRYIPEKLHGVTFQKTLIMNGSLRCKNLLGFFYEIFLDF